MLLLLARQRASHRCAMGLQAAQVCAWSGCERDRWLVACRRGAVRCGVVVVINGCRRQSQNISSERGIMGEPMREASPQQHRSTAQVR